jgi:signal transduction histidine kinase
VANREPRRTNVASTTGKYDNVIVDFLRREHGESGEIGTLMIVPVVARNRPIGAMKVIKKIGTPFREDEHDLELFATFADYVAVAIDNAQIYVHQNERLAVAERNAAMSTLVRAVAHEINNTFGVVPVAIEAIRANLGGMSARVERWLTLLEDVAEQALDFTNGIAGFSAGRLGEKVPSDLNEVIVAAVREVGPELDRYEGKLELALSEQPIICDIYPTPFKQIVRNVVLNAFQALDGERPGLVCITTSAGRGAWSGFAEVAVEDNGIGIRPEHLSRIFEADFTTKPKGNGLGLWLARTQLQTLHGTIDVESEMGRGARFVIRVPQVDSGGEAS